MRFWERLPRKKHPLFWALPVLAQIVFDSFYFWGQKSEKVACRGRRVVLGDAQKKGCFYLENLSLHLPSDEGLVGKVGSGASRSEGVVSTLGWTCQQNVWQKN